MRRLRSALLLAYKVLLRVTNVLPSTLRSWVESWVSFGLLRLANARDDVLEARLDEAVQTLLKNESVDSLGDYLEFGVSFGASLACMYRVARRRRIGQMRLFGFDSFEGLPDAARTDDGGYWSPRMFKSDVRMTQRFLARAGIDPEHQVTLVEGWFADTLTHDLVERHGLRKASVIMVDCDMYSSAKQALDFSGPLIRDQAVVILDDWYSGGLDERNMGERRAFEEFLSDGTFDAQAVGRYGPNAKVFKVSRRPLSGTAVPATRLDASDPSSPPRVRRLRRQEAGVDSRRVAACGFLVPFCRVDPGGTMGTIGGFFAPLVDGMSPMRPRPPASTVRIAPYAPSGPAFPADELLRRVRPFG
jgi:predicted O-methyltransferase YrrM